MEKNKLREFYRSLRAALDQGPIVVDAAKRLRAGDINIDSGGHVITEVPNLSGANSTTSIKGQSVEALELEPSEFAYPEHTGLKNLKSWSRLAPKAKIVKTSSPALTIGVIAAFKSYKIFLLDDNTPVAFLNLLYLAPDLYSPSSFALPKYRGRGLALMLYKWVLDAGISLLNEGTQSEYSSGLWKRLSRDYALVALSSSKTLTGPKAVAVMEHPDYGLALLGKGKTPSQLKGLYHD